MRENIQLHGDHTQGVAVRLGVGDINHSDDAVAVRLVLRYEIGIAQILLHHSDKTACGDIGTAARILRDNHGNVFIFRICCIGSACGKNAKTDCYGCGQKLKFFHGLCLLSL